MKGKSVNSKRLKLRFIEMTDLIAIHELHSYPETDKFNTLGIPENESETKAIIEPWIHDNQVKEIVSFTFAIEDLKSDEFIGMLGLKRSSKKYNKAEVWYVIHPDHWNHGYATEALNAIIKFGFEQLKLHRIEAGCAVKNFGSIRVLQKSGMTQEGRHRKILPLKSGWSDNFSFAILESDYRKSIES